MDMKKLNEGNTLRNLILKSNQSIESHERGDIYINPSLAEKYKLKIMNLLVEIRDDLQEEFRRL